MKKIARGVACLSVVILSGCSGHPATGHWIGERSVETGDPYVALKLEFDGTGALYLSKSNPEFSKGRSWRCLWQAKSADTAEVKCGSANSEDEATSFELVVSEAAAEGGPDTAKFMLSDKAVGRFLRKAKN